MCTGCCFVLVLEETLQIWHVQTGLKFNCQDIKAHKLQSRKILSPFLHAAVVNKSGLVVNVSRIHFLNDFEYFQI